ncbi:MAG: hypothetical protein U0166_00255 [Acidobacteriota bacterium]
MKPWDLLLEWMTHLGSGAWGAFRDAVAELADDSMDEQALLRMLRITFSDLGHVDFFVDGSRRWRVLRPAVVGLSQGPDHLLAGGRTRSMLERLSQALGPVARVTDTENIRGFSSIHVTGDADEVAAALEGTGIDYIALAGIKLAAGAASMRTVLDAGRPGHEPINWSVRSWSFEDRRWVSEPLERTVREYTPRHGDRRFMVHAGKLGLREIAKRESMYCAAILQGARFARFSCAERRLRIPRWAPLPEIYARAVCLSGGRLGALGGDDIIFGNVDPRVASTVLVGLGQGFPMPEVRR